MAATWLRPENSPSGSYCFDTSKMGVFPGGSFAFLDPDMHHYAMAASDVVVQIHGTAPVQFNYINPQDDPSKK
jgi:hypothetical protein